MVVVLVTLMLAAGLVQAQDEVVGRRPYELDWAGRTEDDHPPLIDFEQMGQWRVETENSVAAFTQSREQQIWGDYVAKLTYRFELGTSTRETSSTAPAVYLRPPEPIAIDQPFDAVTMWVYGNNWGSRNDPSTPRIGIQVLFTDSEGREFEVDLTRVRWKEWFLCHRRLTPEQIERVKGGAAFTGFRITNGRQSADRAVYFDNLAVFTEQFPPLHFRPRPRRGIDMFPGQDPGMNTGPGRLPFPDREQTILPPNLTDDFTTSLKRQGNEFVFTYAGSDGTLTWRLRPTGSWDDIVARWQGRGDSSRPWGGGGVYRQTADGPTPPDSIERISVERKGDEVRTRWRLSAGDVSAEVEYIFRLWGKTLVIDTICRGGVVGEVHYGALEGLDNPRLVASPYYHYNRQGRPAVAATGPAAKPLFVVGNTDWYP
ncbi:MAG: hypothetical protein J7M38_03390, partial [Armatimonadetes bacterium]|nr:hypothetical protein [Armatimonadota bacterium]